MADITIRMIFNLETGKKDILIDYEGDEDALPFEHEKRHRQIVQHLLGKGVLQPKDVGEVIVRRGGEAKTLTEEAPTPRAEPEALGEGH